jgi:hypothetical protein
MQGLQGIQGEQGLQGPPGPTQTKLIADIPGVLANQASEAFIESLFGKGLVKGDRLIGVVSFADLPGGMSDGELIFDIFEIGEYSILYSAWLTSTDTEPYFWTATSLYVGPMQWVPRPMEGGEGGGALKRWTKTVISGNTTVTAEVQHTGDTSALEVLTDDIITMFVFVAVFIQETVIGSQTNTPIEEFQLLTQGFYDAGVVRINLSGTDGQSEISANMENWQAIHDETQLGYNEIFTVMSMPMAGRNLQSNRLELRIYYDEDSGEVLADAVFGGGYFMQKFNWAGTMPVNPGDTLELFEHAGFGDYYGIAGMSFERAALAVEVMKFPEVSPYTPYTIETRIPATVNGAEADYTIALVRPSGEQLAKDTESVKIGTSGGFENNSNTLQTYTDGVQDPYITDGVRLLLTNYELGEPLEITGIEIRIQGARS